MSKVFVRLCAVVTLPCAAAACHDEESFLSLADLCPQRAEDLCNARNGGCCAPTDPVTCVDAGVTACLSEQQALTQEASRSYDSVDAERQSRATRAAVDTCGSPLPLASYFKGGLANGSVCDHAAQCASGYCSGSPLVCSDAPPIALCAQ